MCGKKDTFVNLDENISSMAKFHDDRKITVKRKGQILIKAKMMSIIQLVMFFMFLG